MPTKPKTAAKAAAVTRVVRAGPEPAGTFARLRAEATKDQPPLEPYVLNDVDPPISIDPPSSTDQQVGLANLFNNDGDFQLRDAKKVLQLICGDQFPRVWELVRREHISVLVAFIRDMAAHFAGAFPDAGDFPGGSEASPT